MIEENLLKYCKKLYLLFGTKIHRHYFIASSQVNPFFDEYVLKYGYSSVRGESLFYNEYIKGDHLSFWGNEELFFTNKFLELLEKELDN